jgi:GT2 family glycosyltransferase
MKTLIGMVTFGNPLFSKLTIESIKTTTKNPIDFFIVVGKSSDTEIIQYLQESKIPFIVHDKNYGFSYSLNDIYDFAWTENDYDAIILVGNDIVAYPNCIDSLINLARTSEYNVISALQYDVRNLITEFPETRKLFHGDTLIFTPDENNQPWNKFTDYNNPETIADMQLYDIQNCCLYKREFFDLVGYADVNFYPAYYTDNDVARRIVNTGMKCCSLTNARFFHFWSRTLHQGSGGSNSHFFENNRKYYITKWGGDFGKEKWKTPFGGSPYMFRNLILPSSIKIPSRENEKVLIDFWRTVR